MRYIYAVYFALMILMMTNNAVAQDMARANGIVNYPYASGDVRVTGSGKNKIEARSDASEKCFDLRMKSFEQNRGRLPDNEQADAIIDSCVNI